MTERTARFDITDWSQDKDMKAWASDVMRYQKDNRTCYVYQLQKYHQQVAVRIDENGMVWAGDKNVAWMPELKARHITEAYIEQTTPEHWQQGALI